MTPCYGEVWSPALYVLGLGMGVIVGLLAAVGGYYVRQWSTQYTIQRRDTAKGER